MSAQDLSYIIRHDYFQGAMVETLMVGIYTSVVLFAFHRIISERGIRAVLRPPVILMLLMYACAILHLALRWRFAKEAFVDHGQSDQSVIEYLLSKGRLVWIILSVLSRGAIMFLADCIMIWRCWVLYACSWTVILLPLVLLLCELAFVIMRIVQEIPGGSSVEFAASAIKYLLLYQSFTLATTVLVTLLIIYRIVRMGGLRRYQNIVAIIVESAALYAIAIIIYLPFPLSPTLFDIIPNAVLIPMPGIASTLIIARVSLGRGFEHTLEEKESTPGGRQASTLKFQNTLARDMDEEYSSGIVIDSPCDSDMQTSPGGTLNAGWTSGSLRNAKEGESTEKETV